jgi:hypothetical protein
MPLAGSPAARQEQNKDGLAIFDPLTAETNGMIQAEDIEMIGKRLQPNPTEIISTRNRDVLG